MWSEFLHTYSTFFHNKGMCKMDWTPILDFLNTLAPWVIYILSSLGTLVVLGTGIDALIPDEKDKGFMGKVMNIPVLGQLLDALIKYSPFNFKK